MRKSITTCAEEIEYKDTLRDNKGNFVKPNLKNLRIMLNWLLQESYYPSFEEYKEEFLNLEKAGYSWSEESLTEGGMLWLWNHQKGKWAQQLNLRPFQSITSQSNSEHSISSQSITSHTNSVHYSTGETTETTETTENDRESFRSQTTVVSNENVTTETITEMWQRKFDEQMEFDRPGMERAFNELVESRKETLFNDLKDKFDGDSAKAYEEYQKRICCFCSSPCNQIPCISLQENPSPTPSHAEDDDEEFINRFKNKGTDYNFINLKRR